MHITRSIIFADTHKQTNIMHRADKRPTLAYFCDTGDYVGASSQKYIAVCRISLSTSLFLQLLLNRSYMHHHRY